MLLDTTLHIGGRWADGGLYWGTKRCISLSGDTTCLSRQWRFEWLLGGNEVISHMVASRMTVLQYSVQSCVSCLFAYFVCLV